MFISMWKNHKQDHEERRCQKPAPCKCRNVMWGKGETLSSLFLHFLLLKKHDNVTKEDRVGVGALLLKNK